MFHFGGFPSYTYLIQLKIRDSSSRGFPHSEIRGYIAYLQLPAAYRSLSLLRLLMPRHSPYALFSLNFSDNISRYCPRFLVIDSFELVTFFALLFS